MTTQVTSSPLDDEHALQIHTLMLIDTEILKSLSPYPEFLQVLYILKKDSIFRNYIENHVKITHDYYPLQEILKAFLTILRKEGLFDA